MTPAEELGQKEDIAECSKKHPVTEDYPASSYERKTLEELKRVDIVIQERIDKQDDTIQEIKSMLSKQEETNTQIKGLLEALFTRLPPPS